MSKIDYQIEIETLFHKNQLFPRIKNEFVNRSEFLAHMDANEIPEDFGYDLLVQMVLYKRTTLPVLVGILRKHFLGDCQLTADMILKAAQADMVDWDAKTLIFVIKYEITADVQLDLDKYQYPLPMVAEPKTITRNDQSAYYTGNNSVILKHNHHEDDVCLDHINHMNGIKLRINHDTANMIHNRWKHLDKPKDGEDRREYQKRVKAFQKYDKTAHDVLNHLAISDNEFYLTHRYDKRGRIYCQGYHVTYQGNAWSKAIVEFAHEELVV